MVEAKLLFIYKLFKFKSAKTFAVCVHSTLLHLLVAAAVHSMSNLYDAATAAAVLVAKIIQSATSDIIIIIKYT